MLKEQIRPLASEAIKELKKLGKPQKRDILIRFFKTGPGQYGEGDQFLGIVVPDTRRTAKKFYSMALSEIKKLLASPLHEVRLLALFILVHQYKNGDGKEQKRIYRFYLQNIKYVNNWDLVDLSSRDIIGAYIYRDESEKPRLTQLAQAKNLWKRRIAIVSTFYFIRQGDDELTFKMCDLLMKDNEDLIHKACGWMLREVGKRSAEGRERLIEYLEKRRKEMPRTMLRYAIEHFSATMRKRLMSKS